tara:strand:+ start:1571 stop:2020 length:450 start_codon:yes stop_codon:yes gene_type:complete
LHAGGDVLVATITRGWIVFYAIAVIIELIAWKVVGARIDQSGVLGTVRVRVVTAVAIARGPSVAVEILKLVHLAIAVLVDAICHTLFWPRESLFRAYVPYCASTGLSAAVTGADPFGSNGTFVAGSRLTKSAEALAFGLAPVTRVLIAI